MPLTLSDGRVHEYKHAYPKAAYDPDYVRRFKAHCVDDVELAKKILTMLEGKEFAWDTETIGLDFDKPDFLVGFSISCSKDGGAGYYFPLRHKTGDNLPWEIFEIFDELLTKSRTYVYNAPFDLMTMIVSGSKHWRNYNVLDVYVMTYLMDPAWSRDGIAYQTNEAGEKIPVYKSIESYGKVSRITDYAITRPGNGLKFCELHYLGHKAPTFEETLGISSNMVNFSDLDPKDGCKYASIDAAGTYQLGKLLLPILARECKGTLMLDLALAKIFPRILMNEVNFNKTEMHNMYLATKKKRDDLLRGIFKLVGYPFSVSSPIELSKALTTLGVDTGKKNKNGTMSTAKPLIESLDMGIDVVVPEADPIPLNAALISAASLPKQMDYMKKLSSTGKARFRYSSCSMVTGRISSGAGDSGKNEYYVPLNYQNLTKPNPAFFKAEPSDEPGNILGYKFTLLEQDELADRRKNKLPIVEGQSPVRNIRRAIAVPDEDWLFVSRDYCQEELAIAAMISGEPVWEEAIRAGVDLHERTARSMFPEKTYDKHLRKLCKMCNFSLVYGASPGVFAQSAKIDIELAKELHERFWSTLKILANYIEREWVNCLNNNGNVYTMYGRPRRLLSLIQAGDRKLTKDAHKAILSHKVQGTGADVMRRVLVGTFKNGGLADKYSDDYKFVGMIHDETNQLIRKSNFYPVLFEHKELMQQQIPGTDWKLLTSVEVGNSYGETFPFIEKDGILIPQAE